MFLPSDDAKAIADKVLAYSKADACTVQIEGGLDVRVCIHGRPPCESHVEYARATGGGAAISTPSVPVNSAELARRLGSDEVEEAYVGGSALSR